MVCCLTRLEEGNNKTQTSPGSRRVLAEVVLSPAASVIKLGNPLAGCSPTGKKRVFPRRLVSCFPG